jgi:hypothetical protein
MNLFHLDKDVKKLAEYHCDKHVCKMVLETAQMLCSAYKKHYIDDGDLYKIAHPKHPMTLWVGRSHMNFKFALDVLKELGDEYTHRYGKVHASMRIHKLLTTKYNRWHTWDGGFTTPPQCMPDQYKDEDYVKAYRNYYKGEKLTFSKWTKRPTPEFML